MMDLALKISRGEGGRIELALLVQSSMPDYYALFANCGIEPLAMITREFSQVSELDQFFFADCGAEPVGVLCFYPLSERERRQTAALVRAMRSPGASRSLAETLRAHLAALAPIDAPQGLYISRLAVQPALQGRGVADRLLERVESHARSLGLPQILLHVDVANARARGFYERSGFSLAAPETPCQYVVLQKMLYESAAR